MRYYSNSGIFIITILFFFLPFLEIKCKNEPFAVMSGFDLALKNGMAFSNEETTDYMKDNEEFKSLQKTQNRHDPFSIVSIITLLIAALTQLFVKRKRELLAIVFSSIVAVTLIIMHFAFKLGWNKQMDDMGPMKSMFPLTLNFGSGYWLSLITCILLLLLNVFFIVYDNKSMRQIEKNDIVPAPDFNEQV
jgi:hypothetical protein